MTGQIKIESRQFEAALRQLAATTGKSFRQVVDQNARLIAVNLAFQTQPFGNSIASRKQGEAAIMRDIGKVYRPANKVFDELKGQSEDQAKGFYKAIKTGKFALAEDILRRSGIRDRNAEVGEFDAQWHQKSKNRRGRVARNRTALITPDGKAIKDYAKEVQKRVGYAKAGWIAAGEQIGKLSRVPKWLRKNASNGTGTRKGGESNPSVSLNNVTQYISDVLTPAQISEALRIQREKMQAHILHVVSKAGKKSGFRVSGNQGQPAPEP